MREATPVLLGEERRGGGVGMGRRRKDDEEEEEENYDHAKVEKGCPDGSKLQEYPTIMMMVL